MAEMARRGLASGAIPTSKSKLEAISQRREGDDEGTVDGLYAKKTSSNLITNYVHH